MIEQCVLLHNLTPLFLFFSTKYGGHSAEDVHDRNVVGDGV